MNYPDDFSIPTFAAGKSVATSRAMGIAIMCGFLIIIFLCGILVWTVRSARVEPYIISTGGINDQWTIIRPTENRRTIEMTSNQIIQQSVVWKFVQDWFLISIDPEINSITWNSSCERSDCEQTNGSIQCKLFCSADEKVFRTFTNEVLPKYKDLVESGNYWTPNIESIQITPVGFIDDNGGTWQVQMSVTVNDKDTMDIVAYANIGKLQDTHVKTMGYYVADFNAYRVDQ